MMASYLSSAAKNAIIAQVLSFGSLTPTITSLLPKPTISPIMSVARIGLIDYKIGRDEGKDEGEIA